MPPNMPTPPFKTPLRSVLQPGTPNRYLIDANDIVVVGERHADGRAFDHIALCVNAHPSLVARVAKLEAALGKLHGRHMSLLGWAIRVADDALAPDETPGEDEKLEALIDSTD